MSASGIQLKILQTDRRSISDYIKMNLGDIIPHFKITIVYLPFNENPFKTFRKLVCKFHDSAFNRIREVLIMIEIRNKPVY